MDSCNRCMILYLASIVVSRVVYFIIGAIASPWIPDVASTIQLALGNNL